jgi:hypothetical protein
MERFANFLRREDGAVTIDWVVLTAAIIGLCMIVLTPFAYSTDSLTKKIAEEIESQPVGNSKN